MNLRNKNNGSLDQKTYENNCNRFEIDRGRDS